MNHRFQIPDRSTTKLTNVPNLWVKNVLLPLDTSIYRLSRRLLRRKMALFILFSSGRMVEPITKVSDYRGVFPLGNNRLCFTRRNSPDCPSSDRHCFGTRNKYTVECRRLLPGRTRGPRSVGKSSSKSPDDSNSVDIGSYIPTLGFIYGSYEKEVISVLIDGGS